MCRTNFKGYDEETLLKLKKHYDSLPEKASRHFLAMEFERLGKGSKSYLARVFECSRRRVHRGVLELRDASYCIGTEEQRRKGGGRKKREN